MFRKCHGLDGNLYDSHQEAQIAEWLMAHGIEYEPHKRLPKPSRQISDFYLPKFDLWVEWDGLMQVRADDKLVRKHLFYREHGMKYVVLNRDNWESTLYEAIFDS